jgi:ABC-type phosphate/phosphonate transport system substrate-binding protein
MDQQSDTHKETTVRRRDLFALIGALCLANSSARGQSATGFVFGMVPYLPVQQLVRLYEPLVAQLERSLSRSGRLASAPDFEQFIERARKGEFDLVGASPHVARLLHREEGFLPLVRATAPLQPLIVVPVESRIQTLEDLKGTAALVADLSAVHVLIALRFLRDQGLTPGGDIKLVVAGTQRNAVQRMLKGDAAAAVGSASTLGLLPAELATKFRVLSKTPAGLTPMAYLAHPRLKAQIDALSAGLLSLNDTEIGQTFFKAAQHDSYVALTAAKLATADPLVTEYYRQRALN